MEQLPQTPLDKSLSNVGVVPSLSRGFGLETPQSLFQPELSHDPTTSVSGGLLQSLTYSLLQECLQDGEGSKAMPFLCFPVLYSGLLLFGRCHITKVTTLQVKTMGKKEHTTRNSVSTYFNVCHNFRHLDFKCFFPCMAFLKDDRNRQLCMSYSWSEISAVARVYNECMRLGKHPNIGPIVTWLRHELNVQC